MLAIARANGTDTVLSPDGTGRNCAQPMTVSTGAATQSKVFIGGILVAVIGDIIQPHPLAGCILDVQQLSSASTRVFVSGKGLARIGDKYGNNTITSGSSKCFSN